MKRNKKGFPLMVILFCNIITTKKGEHYCQKRKEIKKHKKKIQKDKIKWSIKGLMVIIL